MLSPQLRKLKIQLEAGREQIDIDKEQLLKELNELDEIKGILLEVWHCQQKYAQHVERGCKYGL